MRVNGIPNKYEILQEYYLELNGEEITYNEAMTRYYELDTDERQDFVNYYNDYCKEYYGDDTIDYEPLDGTGYTWRNAASGEFSTLSKNDLRVKYTLDAYAKEQGLTLDPQWAGYSAEEIIQMENNGVNIPKDVLEIAHSIYETTGSNYLTTESEAEENATSEKEPFLELVPKAAKKIQRCEENNEKISDAIDELLPEKNERERKLKDKMKDQRQSLEEYEALIKEWNKIQTKVNNGEALSDKEAQRYAELTGMFEEKKSDSDDAGFSIDKREIAKSLNEINIYVTLGEDLANETIEISDTLADYTSKTNYKTTAQSVSKEVGFIRTLIAMAKGKNLAEEANKVGNDTKEYTSETKTSVNDIATVLDIKDQLVSTEEINTPESETGTGAVQETDPESNQAKEEAKAPGVTEEEDFVITDESIQQLTSEASELNKDLLGQTIHAIKSIKVAKDDKKFAALANLKVTRLVKDFKAKEEERKQETESLEEENKQLKKEITDITGESEDEIDQNLNSGEDDSEKYDGMEESDKQTVQSNKQRISANNQAIANLQQEEIDNQQTFKENTSKEKAILDKAIPEETQEIANNTKYQQEVIPAAKEQLSFTANNGLTLKRIGRYRFKLGMRQFLSRKGIINMAKGIRSMRIGQEARDTASTRLPELAEKITGAAVESGNTALNSLNKVNGQIVAITGEDTPQGVSQGDEDQKQQEENQEKADDKPVTNATNSSESPEEGAAKTGNQATETVKETTSAVATSNPSPSAPVPVSPATQAASIEGMRSSTRQTNKGNQAAAKTGAAASKRTGASSASGGADEVPAVTKDNAKSEAADANKNLGGIKSDTAKDQKETESITKDEEKSEKQLEKEAKNLEKQIKKEAKEMEKLQKETEQIQQKQTQILQEFEQLSVQNEQLVAEAQSAAMNQPAQPANNNQGQQAGGLLGSNSFNAGGAQNNTVNEKVSSIETNNQRITQLGIEFTANDKIVLRNQKKITNSQKFIKTSNKRFQKVTKTKEKKANERVKAEEAKQKALQKKLGLVGIFEKVFQVVTSIGALLSAIPFTAPLGAILTNIGVGGTLFCATVKAGILAANGMIQQAFMTLGMSIATAALSMVGAGSAASGALQIATASLNVVSSAASLGASVQEFKGKDSGILGSIATIAGAASAITGAVGAFGSLGKAGTTALSKMSTIAMQSGSILSTSSQMINQVREWQGKEGDSKVANIMGMVGMGLTLVGTAGNIASSIQDKKAGKVDKTEKKEGKDGENKTEKGDGENGDKKAKTDEGEGSSDEQTSGSQNPGTTDGTTPTDKPATDTGADQTEVKAPQTDAQQQQGEQLKEAATQDSQQQTEEAVQEIEQTVENNSNPEDKGTSDDITQEDVAPEGNAPKPEGEQGGEPKKSIEDMTPEERMEEMVKAARESSQKAFKKTIDDLKIDPKSLKIDPKITMPQEPQQSKFAQFMEKAQPYMEMVGTAAQLATSIMASNDETDDDTKRKVVPAWEFDRRTQEIMKKRRKRQAALRRYFA